MAETSQFESDELLKLLTDALRSGPGSPQWHDALTRLRADNLPQADEYRLLMEAREHLESGRDYRSIRPGPEFTRKVMEAIDHASENRPGLPSANLIAALAGLGILAMVIVVGVLLLRSPTPGGSVEDLKGTYFSQMVVPGDFTQSIGSEWKRFGVEPVISSRDPSLRGGFKQDGGQDYRRGGLYAANSVPALSPFALDATVHIRKASNNVDVQFFVAEDSPANAAEGTSPRGLVVEVRDGQVSVFLADGTLAGTQAKAEGRFPLLIKVDRQFAVVECGGILLYAGPHHLAMDKPRWPGVRFISRGPEKALDDVTVPMMRILRP